MGKKAQQKVCCSCSAEAPAWDLVNGKSRPLFQHRKKCGTGPSKTGPKAGQKIIRQGRIPDQESTVTLTLPPPRPSSNHPLHGRYLGGGTNVETTVQMQCGCKNMVQIGYFLVFVGFEMQSTCTIYSVQCITRESPPL